MGAGKRAMIVKEPKYRKQLSDNQKLLLGLSYKFRFITLDLVAQHLGKSKSAVYESLDTIERQGYITKLYDPSFKLRHRPASYTLAPKGINYLMKSELQPDQQHLKNFYKNRKAPEELIDRHLLIYQIFLVLKPRFGKSCRIFSRYEFNREAFVEPMPDLYLETKGDKPNYVLDIIDAGTPNWLLRRRINQHDEFAEDSDYRYPDVLFIAGNVSTENRLFKMTFENYCGFEFYITRLDLLFGSEDKIWTDNDESDEDEIVRKSLS